MIISASRRTDIPAFYAKWFINRVHEGYCTVPNPFNHKQVARITLKPRDVDVIVFWTRNPAPLLPYLDELDTLGFRYYFQYTLLKNPRELEEKSPSFDQSVNTFRQLSEKIGSSRVIWRYDPIVFTELTGMRFHMEAYEEIAGKLKGFTNRSVISIMDSSSQAQKRIRELEKQGIHVYNIQGFTGDRFDTLMRNLVKSANSNGMEIVSCAEELELATYGIKPGKCIDDEYVKKIFGFDVTHKKDPGQRKACGCVISQDIGMYDSCLFGCQYCYATSSFERARLNHSQHDPKSPSLIGWYEAKSDSQDPQLKMFSEGFDNNP
jgi:transcriptional regulator